MSRLAKIDLIDPSPWAALFEHPEDHIARLAEDIAERGITTPLHVYPRGERYELLTGHDRLEAAKRAGLAEVPVETRSTLADEDARFAYFIRDNTLRKDINKTALARAVVLRTPDAKVEAVALTAGVSVGTAHAAIAQVRAERPDIFNTEITDTIGRERPRTYTPREKPMAERAKEQRERETDAPVITRRDGSIDPLRTMRAQRERDAVPVPEPPMTVADHVADVKREVASEPWGRLSKWIVTIRPIPQMSDDELTEAVNAPDFDDYDMRCVQEAADFLARALSARKEATDAAA